MRLGGRAAAAIEVLAEVESRRRPVSESLKDWGIAHRFAGSGDRAVIGNIVYDALRWRASSAWVAGDDAPRAVVMGMLAHHWNLNLAEAFAGDTHAPEPPTVEQAAHLAAADIAEAPPHIQADVPEWTASRLERVLGADWVAEGQALAERPPLDMRANRLRSDRGRVLEALRKFGAVATAYATDALRIAPTSREARHPNVQVEPAFQKGWFEVQDEGSQIAALAVAAKPGEQILDLCAGAGGKTLALAAAMGGKGRVIATEGDRARLAPIFERLKRAGAHNVEVREARATVDDLAGKMDAVLIDAPCTGSGTWRRRPDAKWRLTERALGNRIGDQAAVLATAAPLPKPGGRLVYVTCSLLPEENEDQVAAFVAANAGYRVVPPADVIARSGSAPALADAALIGSSGFILTPQRTGTDGFFVSVMERVK